MEKKTAGVRIFARVFAFCLIFLMLLCVLSYILRPYSGSVSRNNFCGFYAEEEDSLDLVFVGSSSCFAFWEPLEFWEKYGVASYNFAAGTMPPQMLKYCIREVRKTQDPEVFVIDLRPFTVAEVGYYLEESVPNMDHEVPLRNTIDNVKYSLNRLEMIWDCVPDEYDKLPYYFDIIKYHTEWPRLADAESLSYRFNSSYDPFKGFRLVDSVKKVEFHDHSALEERAPLSGRLERILYDLLDYCQEEKLQALFLVNAYCQSSSDKKMYNTISDIVSEYGYPFLNTNDYYQEIGLDYSTDYYDYSHVNIFGADKYTEFVGTYLEKQFSFEDHRGQEGYARWEEDYAQWAKETEQLKENIQEKIDARQA